MPNRLSLRSTLLLIALAFGLAFAIQVLLGDASSAAKPAAKQSAPGFVTNAPGPRVALSQAAAGKVPALRDARKKVARKRKPSVRRVVQAAPTVTPTPVMPAATMSPTPTATPPYILPAPPRMAPKPVPTPTPKPPPTSTPPDSGEFDSTGEP